MGRDGVGLLALRGRVGESGLWRLAKAGMKAARSFLRGGVCAWSREGSVGAEMVGLVGAI